MDEQYATIVQQCLAWIEAGATIEECRDTFPQYPELEGLLRTATQLQAQQWPAMPPLTHAALTATLRAQVAIQRSERIESQSARPATYADWPDAHRVALHNQPRVLSFRDRPRSFWVRLIGVVLSVLFALAFGAGAGSLARTLIQGVGTAPLFSSAGSNVDPFTLNGTIQQISAHQWVVEYIPVMIEPQTIINGIPAVGAIAAIQGDIQEDGRLHAQLVTIAGLPTAAVPPAPTDTTVVAGAIAEPTAVPGTPAPTTDAASLAEPTVLATVIPTALPSTLPTIAAATALPPPLPTSAPAVVPTIAAATAIPPPLPTSTPAAVPTVVVPTAPPTAVPTQVPPTAVPVEPSVVPSPTVALDQFTLLRTLITAGIADGRVQPQAGEALLKNLDQAQEAASAGDTKQLRDRLRDMQKDIREQLRAGTIDAAFAPQVLDAINLIASTFQVQIPAGTVDDDTDNSLTDNGSPKPGGKGNDG